MLRLEQDGPESCQLATNSSFVLVTIPVRVVGDGVKAEVAYRCRVGSFAGRDMPVTLRAGLKTSLSLRIPRERFQAREFVEVVVSVPGVVPPLVLWSRKFEIANSGAAPELKRLED